ncbi:MAG: hypothetical protein QXL94_01380 [Candidatus Parvarchaeum sp.]
MQKVVVKKGWAAVGIWAFLLALAVFFFSGSILNYYDGEVGLAGGGALAFFVFAVSLIALRPRKRKEIKDKIQNKMAIVGRVDEREHFIDGKPYGREIVRLPVYEKQINFNDDVLLPKSNQNIAIIGMAGSGKTQFTYYIISQMKYHKIIFQYKNSDRYSELGFPVLFLKKYSPDVFRDKEAFVQAWITAFAVENRGIMASQITPLVRRAVEKSRNWREFKEEIEKQIKANEGTITGSVYSDIRVKLESVYSEEQYDLEIPQDIVIDFEGLNQDAFVFYAEYLLRELYEEIKSGRRDKAMIFVDEAHVFTRTTNTIIPELSAIIRSRGAFLFATQRASTIAGDIKGNAGTQFCFRQTEKDDLDQVRALSEPFHWIVQRLNPYEAVDLNQPESQDGVYIYRLINPKPEFKPVMEWKPEEQEKQDNGGKGSIDLTGEVIRLLSRPANQQDLAKRFVKEWGKDVSYWKLTLKTILVKMNIQGEISAVETNYVKFIGNKAYVIEKSPVYHRKGDYSYHDWLVGIVADILYHKGLNLEIQAHGLSLPDILVKKEKLAFEIETGSKNGYKMDETKERIAGYEKQGYKVYVVVPNNDVKEKYTGFKNVMTALELWEVNEW